MRASLQFMFVTMMTVTKTVTRNPNTAMTVKTLFTEQFQ